MADNKKYYAVYNKDKTERFITADRGLAYEVRKGADSNCYDANGTFSKVGVEFCEKWSWNEDCTMSEIIVIDNKEFSLEFIDYVVEMTGKFVSDIKKENVDWLDWLIETYETETSKVASITK